MNTTRQILLVDDDHQVVRYLQKILEEAGYSVNTVSSGSEALSHLEEPLPDLLILDLNMPEPDGFDILRQARSRFPFLRILVISGYVQGILLKSAKILGASATLEKPITAEALLGAVRKAFGGQTGGPGNARRSFLPGPRKTN